LPQRKVPGDVDAIACKGMWFAESGPPAAAQHMFTFASGIGRMHNELRQFCAA